MKYMEGDFKVSETLLKQVFEEDECVFAGLSLASQQLPSRLYPSQQLRLVKATT